MAVTVLSVMSKSYVISGVSATATGPLMNDHHEEEESEEEEQRKADQEVEVAADGDGGEKKEEKKEEEKEEEKEEKKEEAKPEQAVGKDDETKKDDGPDGKAKDGPDGKEEDGPDGKEKKKKRVAAAVAVIGKRKIGGSMTTEAGREVEEEEIRDGRRGSRQTTPSTSADMTSDGAGYAMSNAARSLVLSCSCFLF